MTSRHDDAWDSPGFLLWHATLRWQRAMVEALSPLGLTHTQFVLLASTWWLAENGDAAYGSDGFGSIRFAMRGISRCTWITFI